MAQLWTDAGAPLRGSYAQHLGPDQHGVSPAPFAPAGPQTGTPHDLAAAELACRQEDWL